MGIKSEYGPEFVFEGVDVEHITISAVLASPVVLEAKESSTRKMYPCGGQEAKKCL